MALTMLLLPAFPSACFLLRQAIYHSNMLILTKLNGPLKAQICYHQKQTGPHNVKKYLSSRTKLSFHARINRVRKMCSLGL
ncbi:hypothetical protein YC2023_005995 [Brassica napus]